MPHGALFSPARLTDLAARHRVVERRVQAHGEHPARSELLGRRRALRLGRRHCALEDGLQGVLLHEAAHLWQHRGNGKEQPTTTNISSSSALVYRSINFTPWCVVR